MKLATNEKLVRFGFLARIGMAATRIRFNETTLVEVGDGRCWAKRRLPWSPLLVRLANAYAKATGLPMRMLGERQWQDYETLVFRELLGLATPFRKGKRLLLPEAQGEPLGTILANSSMAQKQAALELAAGELGRLHQQKIRHPLAGCLLPFSHGDATPDNVVVDLDGHRATWVDFETVHPADMPACLRQADDLRALLCGLAPILPADELFGTVTSMLAIYKDEEVLLALRGSLCDWNRRSRARSLAMAATGEGHWRCLLQAVCSVI